MDHKEAATGDVARPPARTLLGSGRERPDVAPWERSGTTAASSTTSARPTSFDREFGQDAETDVALVSLPVERGSSAGPTCRQATGPLRASQRAKAIARAMRAFRPHSQRDCGGRRALGPEDLARGPVHLAARCGEEQALPGVGEPALEVVWLPVAVAGEQQIELG